MAALLLDENMPRSAGRRLAAAGHDVRFVGDMEPAADDRRVLALALEHQRVLVTFDADFGDLVFQQRLPAPPSVLYLRLHPVDSVAAAELILRALASPVLGQFVACTREATRRRELPRSHG